MNAFHRLPEELLDAILQTVSALSNCASEWVHARLVCRRWARLLLPTVFETVHLYYGLEHTSAVRIGMFLNLLQSKPILWHYISHLHLQIAKHDAWVHEHFIRILDSSSSKLQSLTIQIDPYDDELPPLYVTVIRQKRLAVLKKVASMNLKTLTLSGVSYNSIMSLFNGTDLENLSLSRCFWSLGASDPVTTTSEGLASLRSDVQFLCPRECYRRGKLKRLSMASAYGFYDGALPHLLEWPAQLEEISFDCSTPGQPRHAYADQFDLPDVPPVIQAALEGQRDSLRTITIGVSLYFETHSRPPVDFSTFPRLKRLKIHAINFFFLGRRSGPIISLDSLLAPQLNELELFLPDYLITYGSHGTTHSLVRWLRSIAEHISRNIEIWPATLKTISVTTPSFDPKPGDVGWPYSSDEDVDLLKQKWPDEWLVPAKEIMSEWQVQVKYAGPTWKWDSIITEEVEQ